MKVAVLGGGWAGIAAAVETTRLGNSAVLFEMAKQLGGRARTVAVDGFALDNGQHILIGAYTQTLALMRTVGVDVAASLLRMPLRISYADGSGLRLGPGPATLAFAAALLRYRGWRFSERTSLLAAAGSWALRGFRCEEGWTVSHLCRALPPRVRAEFIEPLCVAALNTPADQASAAVFLRVLRDALFSGPGSADLLLPRKGLSALLAEPAAEWLLRAGSELRLSTRAMSLLREGTGWLIDAERFDAVIVASSAAEAVRLLGPIHEAWAQVAAGLRYEPIVTVYARSQGTSLPQPMMALRAGAGSPAQFVFDHGQMSGQPGLLAMVVSGAAPWIESGLEATAAKAIAQARRELGAHLKGPLELVHTLSERRATFLCTPALQRPAAHVAPGCRVAGDYVDGPYPATLEGAVRSGIMAARSLRNP